MLPTKGYFKDIDCPYHERSCGRPFCHFRHRKKTQDTEEIAPAKKTSSAAVPTYKPTPIKELTGAGGRSHLPICYVPDVVPSSSRKLHAGIVKPQHATYKPTPKSVLSSTVPVNIVSTYTPTPIDQLKQSGHDELLDLMTLEMLDDENLCKESEHNTDNETTEITTAPAENVKSQENTEIVEIKKKRKSNERSKEKSPAKSRDKHQSRKKSSSESSSSHKRSTEDKESVNTREKRNDKGRHNSSTSKSDKNKGQKEQSSQKSSSSKRREHRSPSKKSKSSEQKTKENNAKDKHEAEIEIHTPFTLDQDDKCDADADDAEIYDEAYENMLIESECFQIFNEYKPPSVASLLEPPPPSVASATTKETESNPYPAGKRRIAYNNACEREPPKLARAAVKPRLSAGATMQNRIRIAQQTQASNECQNLMAEMKKRPAPTPMPVAKKPKFNGQPKLTSPATAATPPASSSLIDDILSGRSTSSSTSNASKPRRFAPVANVLSIQQAKAKIDAIKNRAVAAKTIAQTAPASGKRVAHVPDTSLANIPDVLHAASSKLPVNVRTRYLGLIADETVKLYISVEDAHNRALEEEYACNSRCKTLLTYRNSSMLVVNRIRKELQARNDAGLGPYQVGKTPSKPGESILLGKRFYDLVKPYMLSDEELVKHGFPQEGQRHGRAIIHNEFKQPTRENLGPDERLCCRCQKVYLIDNIGFPQRPEECCYHPLKKRTIRGDRIYLCCKSMEDTGCVISPTHVSEVSADRELEGFQSTIASDRADDPRDHAVYALDCEMCYTTKGLELTRLTVVDSKLNIVYESLVKPFNPIIDYNTRFSGITPEQMEHTTTNILQIQATMLSLCSADTILIGHSLESDMKALKIIHKSIVDTSIIFPHKFGLPHKRALRMLASEYLKKIIQNDVGGHDSAEDAVSAMELVVWKVREDLKVKGIKA